MRKGTPLASRVAQGGLRPLVDHGEEEDEQAQLIVAPPQGEAQGLEASGVTCQLKDAENTHDPKDLDHAADVLELQHALVGFSEEDHYFLTSLFLESQLSVLLCH